MVRWLERITRVGNTYRFTEDVLVLAAVSQMKGQALEWHNRRPIESVASWENFKYHLK